MRNLKLLLTTFLMSAALAVSAQTANVQIIHNSADAAASTVDVYVNTTLVLNDVNFREASAFLSVPSNTPIDVTIQPSTSSDTTNGLYRETFTLDSNENYVIVANGIISASGYTPNQPFALDVFPMARQTAVGGASDVDVLVCHGSTDAPIVDIFESSVPAGTIVDNIAYGEFAGYLALDTGNYTVQVRDSANSKILAT